MRRTFLALALALSGCSLLAEFAEECSTTADCEAPLICVDNLCVRPEDGAGGGGGMDAAGGAGGSGGADAGEAADAAVAVDAALEPDTGPAGLVLDEVCHTLHGVAVDDALDPSKTVLFGVLMPKTGGLGALGPTISQAAYLAVDEINQSGGLGDGRRVGLLDCDTATNPDAAVVAAQRLVEAGVPAIIGAAASSSTIQVFNEVARPAGVLMISPSSTTPAITELPDDDLLWRTAPSDAIQGAAIAAFLVGEGLEEKVAVVNRDDVYGNGLRQALQDVHCQRPAGCTEDNYFSRTYPAEGATAEQFSPILFDLQAFEPDIVVLIAFVEDGVEFLQLAAQARLERFVLTDGAKKIDLVERLDRGAETLLRNLLGTAPASPAGDIFQDFALSYSSKWQGQQPDVFNAHAYDAAWLLGYAVGALPADAPITGAAIAQQLRRMSDGPAIRAGADDWNRGLTRLRSDDEATIDFQGASGELDFLPRGEAAGDIEGWRFDVDAVRIQSLGVIYTAAGEYIAPDLDPPEPDAGVDAGVDAGR